MPSGPGIFILFHTMVEPERLFDKMLYTHALNSLVLFGGAIRTYHYLSG